MTLPYHQVAATHPDEPTNHLTDKELTASVVKAARTAYRIWQTVYPFGKTADLATPMLHLGEALNRLRMKRLQREAEP